MDYGLAIASARLSLLLAALAAGYYLLRTLFVALQRRGLAPEAAQYLRQAVAFARLSHPYVAALLGIAPLYHIYVMWMTHSLSLKVALGFAVAATVLFMAATGWWLKGYPAAMDARLVHRRGLFVLAAVLAAHRLV